jgi:hypothetical protein
MVGSKITCTILGHFFETLNFVPKSPFELPKVAMVPIKTLRNPYLVSDRPG